MKKTPKTLTKAPIREALIDFRVQLPPNFEIGRLLKAYSRFEKEMPFKESITESSTRINFGPGGILSSENPKPQQAGFRFKSSDNLNTVQYKLTGFTFNRLTPYKDWEHLITQTKRFWSYFIGEIGECSVSRIGLRYINSIPLPMEKFKMEDYLTVFPTVPDTVNVNVNGFFHRTSFTSNDKTENSGIMTLTVESAGKTRNLIFDIDVFDSRSFESDSEAIWEALGSLRNLKNEIFFEQLTLDALKGFE